jgi:hypothetical protein
LTRALARTRLASNTASSALLTVSRPTVIGRASRSRRLASASASATAAANRARTSVSSRRSKTSSFSTCSFGFTATAVTRPVIPVVSRIRPGAAAAHRGVTAGAAFDACASAEPSADRQGTESRSRGADASTKAAAAREANDPRPAKIIDFLGMPPPSVWSRLVRTRSCQRLLALAVPMSRAGSSVHFR